MRTFLQYKNDQAIAAWGKRKALTGGQDLLDMRNAAQLSSWTVFERRSWKAQAFMIHVRRHLEAVAAAQRERLRYAMNRHKGNRVQHQLF
jgi:hypothetical protein